ncbi:cytochrome P450 709B1-like, partial [Zingiber officinale]|uniref:cytochrome P450 709B1-like n=1 Tax=Zingiber officinale TaxID=94328 RepID=UPI001C4B1770
TGYAEREFADQTAASRCVIEVASLRTRRRLSPRPASASAKRRGIDCSRSSRCCSGEILCSKKSYQAWRLGKHIDRLLHDIVCSRREQGDSEAEQQHDLLRQLLEAENRDGRRRKFAARGFMDEYKTFFFTGHETTALALCWPLIFLALHPKWQSILREEVELVSVGRPFDSDVLSRLTKANKKN